MIVASEILSPGWGSLNHDYRSRQSEHLFDRDLDGVDHGNHLLSDNARLRFAFDPEKRRGASNEVRESDRMIKVEERIKSITESPQVGSSDVDRKPPRVCADCQTSKTPLWRGGPAGPKSLCNACGIRYRKRRRRGVALTETGRDMLLDSNNRQEKILLLLQREFVGEEDTEAAILLMAMSCGLFVSS